MGVISARRAGVNEICGFFDIDHVQLLLWLLSVRQTFSFDVKLQAIATMSITPNDVKAQYCQATGMLTVQVYGVEMISNEETEPSFFDKMKLAMGL
jgi:hypothetical protein